MAKNTNTTVSSSNPNAKGQTMAKSAPTAPEAPSAKPGTTDEAGKKGKKAKKEKTPRVAYPGLKGADEKPVRLTAWPTDFDPKTHKPLKRDNFENEAVWYDHMADEYEARAKDYREQAELSRKLGNQSDRQKAKKLAKMQNQMAKLQEELKSQGIDVAALLGALTGGQAESK